MCEHIGPVAGDPPLVSIVVVTFNALEYVRKCVESVLARTHVPFEFIVVDNASEAETREYLKSVQGIRLVLNERNKLWCAGCNDGIRISDPRSKYVLLLNSDVEAMRDDWIEVLVTVIESDPRVAIAGPQHIKVKCGPLFGYIDGHCLLFRRTLLEAQGGQLDEERWPWAGAPAELAVAAYSKGWIYKVVHSDDAVVFHHESKSRTPEMHDKLKVLPRPKPVFTEIMARYGIKPTTAFTERSRLFKPFRKIAEQRRFYYSPPVGKVSLSK